MTADELAELSEKAARLLFGGGGLKALAQLLADATAAAVLIEDDQWRHVALAEPRGGIGPLPPSFSPFFREAGSSARSNGTVVRAQISESLHALCAQMPVQSDGESALGYVTIFFRGRPGFDAAPALRVTASAAAVELLRRGSSRGQARRVFWEEFLAGDIADAADLRHQATAAGVSLAPSYVVAAFDVEGVAGSAARDAISLALSATDAVCPLLESLGQVIALFPIHHQVDVARARQAAAHAIRDLPGKGAARAVTCGMGSHHPGVLEVPLSLREARESLSLGRRLFGRGSLAVYPDLGIYALLHAGADREAFLSFANALIDPLAAYDKRHKTDLLKTLQLYFEVGENVKEAAERLSVHRHTIFYRLNQISQILKVDLKTPKDQLSVRAALAIKQMDTHERAHD